MSKDNFIIFDDDFEEMWAEQQREDDKILQQPDDINELPPQHVVNRQVARCKQLSQLVLLYYHSKLAEPTLDVVFGVEQEFLTEPNKSIEFHV